MRVGRSQKADDQVVVERMPVVGQQIFPHCAAAINQIDGMLLEGQSAEEVVFHQAGVLAGFAELGLQVCPLFGSRLLFGCVRHCVQEVVLISRHVLAAVGSHNHPQHRMRGYKFLQGQKQIPSLLNPLRPGCEMH